MFTYGLFVVVELHGRAPSVKRRLRGHAGSTATTAASSAGRSKEFRGASKKATRHHRPPSIAPWLSLPLPNLLAAMRTHTNDLPADLWALVAKAWDSDELWRLYGTNRGARDGVVLVVMEREALRRGQAIAFFRIVQLCQNAFLTGGAGSGKSHVMRQAVNALLAQEKKVD